MAEVVAAATDATAWVLHRDHRIVVVNKPSGITVIPGREQTLADSLRGRLQQALDAPLWVVHRIDRETSGLVVFARDPEAHKQLCGQFEHHQTRKTYWALASAPTPEAGQITIPLHSARKGKMRPALPGEAGALAAHTSYRRLDAWTDHPPITLLEISLHTGRQHQIRVHLRAIGAALHGDPLYGASTAGLADPAPRLGLHAWKLAFRHPETGQMMQHEAPLPADLLRWLPDRLQRSMAAAGATPCAVEDPASASAGLTARPATAPSPR